MDDPAQRPLVIGWKEVVELPEWGIRRLRIKADTGARTSAIDVLKYAIDEADAAGPVVELELALDPRHRERVQVVRAPLLGQVLVRNSGGQRECRPLVETTLRLGPVTKRVRLTVANRAGLRFRMLLGRQALLGDFLVDVGQKYLWKRVAGGG
jgi:hypothetical protein